jgi:hypothetical protein
MQYDYGNLIGMSYKFYDAERIGALPANYTIPWRGPAFLQASRLLSNPESTLFAQCMIVQDACNGQ